MMDGGGERAEHEIKASISRPQLWLRAVGGARSTELHMEESRLQEC